MPYDDDVTEEFAATTIARLQDDVLQLEEENANLRALLERCKEALTISYALLTDIVEALP